MRRTESTLAMDNDTASAWNGTHSHSTRLSSSGQGTTTMKSNESMALRSNGSRTPPTPKQKQQQRQQNQSLKGEYRLKRKTLQRLRDPLHMREAQRASRQAAQLMGRQVSTASGHPGRQPTTSQPILPWIGSSANGGLGRQRRGRLGGLIRRRLSSDPIVGTLVPSTGRTTVSSAVAAWGTKSSRPTLTTGSQTTQTTKMRPKDEAIWMCGVCGLVFASRHSADVHEQQHIQTVVAGMKWDQSDPQRATVPATTSTPQATASRLDPPVPPLRLSTLDNWNGVVLDNMVNIENDDDSIFEDRPPPIPESSLSGEDALLLSNDFKLHGVLADEALVDVVSRAVPLILTPTERDAERELLLLARDKSYYDELSKRAVARRTNPSNRFRSDGEDLIAKVQNKFLDAYQIMKESDGQKGMTDQYQRQTRPNDRQGRGVATPVVVGHTTRTLYVNVMVKNSVQVVRHELERLAKQRWEASHVSAAPTTGAPSPLTRFEQFRVYTQQNVVKLAGIALASDFTPRRIAVQLSNDLYRLMTPRLKRRGVTIETEIEYRVGPYFVLAVNIQSIDWPKLIRATYRDAAQRKAKWDSKQDNTRNSDSKDASSEALVARPNAGTLYRHSLDFLRGALNLSLFEMIERSMVFLHNLHYVVYLPLCWVAYYLFLGTAIRQFILSSVADEIFYYVEEKGMAMDIHVCRAEAQAAFMLAALREIRADGQEKQKRKSQSGGASSHDGRNILGPLMGPAIPADQGPAPPPPEGFVTPENLEFIGLELDLPVGFQRMRWALLSKRSEFVTEALYKTEAKYENSVMGEWNKLAEHIGEPKLPDTIDQVDFIGAEKEAEYLMPKSAFVSANMCYETHYILAYNEYCFCLKKKARNPDAPFGKTFIAWTQYLVVNTGNNTCRLTCSVQPEFPNGEPMVSRQIRGGMRAGTGEVFVLLGETVAKYANAYT